MKTFLLCAALLGAGLAQAADDIDDVRVIAGCRLDVLAPLPVRLGSPECLC
ncbi:hypothetical protein DZ910_032685, partial [Pseudomonas aeruginosa]|nr:hypothetical protein [Pseudomonas aeruginosa]